MGKWFVRALVTSALLGGVGSALEFRDRQQNTARSTYVFGRIVSETFTHDSRLGIFYSLGVVNSLSVRHKYAVFGNSRRLALLAEQLEVGDRVRIDNTGAPYRPELGTVLTPNRVTPISLWEYLLCRNSG